MNHYFININNEFTNSILGINYIEKSINYMVEYCYLFLHDKQFLNDFDFDKEQLDIHKQFITRKLEHLNNILEYKVENEIRDKYKILENILDTFEIEYIINNELSKNKYVSMSRNMLLEIAYLSNYELL